MDPIHDPEEPASLQDTAGLQRSFPCSNCGAKLHYQPGTQEQKCPYCGASQEIAQTDAVVVEHDFRSCLQQLEEQSNLDETLTIKCQACAAEFTSSANVTAQDCPFCGTPVVSTAVSRKHIKPQALLPFKVVRTQGQELFKKWIGSLWFAPGALKKQHHLEERLSGMYIPYWTYDSDTTTHYIGRRGEHYWETQHYTAHENGKAVQRTRRVRKTRWYPASGTVRHFFDDVLILASRSLPRKHTEKLEPWDLPNLIPYQDDYLSGFRAESYQIDLAEGFASACQMMDSHLHMLVRRDIGGDEQQILSMNTQHDKITYKHILLPVWLSAYRYGKNVYRFLINGRTGEVQGERPWSAWKIAGAVLAALAGIGLVVLLVHMKGTGGSFSFHLR